MATPVDRVPTGVHNQSNPGFVVKLTGRPSMGLPCFVVGVEMGVTGRVPPDGGAQIPMRAA